MTLNDLIKQRGVRMDFLAEKLGLSLPTLRKYRDKPITALKLETALKICELFNLDIATLIGGRNEK